MYNKIFKSIIKLTIFLILTAFLFECSYNDKPQKKIIIGTTVGEFADMVKEKIKPLLEKQRYKIKLIEFSDYIRPNIALKENNIDINIFQHLPYLKEYQKKNNDYSLIKIFQVPTAPLGLYSGKLLSLQNIHKNISIAIPNDTVNLSRGLLLIEKLSWIKLKKNHQKNILTTKDIIDNPYNIKFIELEAAQLPRARNDVDYVVINGNYAVSASIPINSALFQDKDITYINWAVIKKSDLNQTWVKDITNAYNSSEFKQYIYKRFPGYFLPLMWKDKQ